jgi:hypothetical protein
MVDMTPKGKRPRDANQLAKWIVDRATGQIPAPDPNEGKSPAAVKRGRAGGVKGGKSRAANLNAAERKAIAKLGATGRWNRGKHSDDSGTAE